MGAPPARGAMGSSSRCSERREGQVMVETRLLHAASRFRHDERHDEMAVVLPAAYGARPVRIDELNAHLFFAQAPQRIDEIRRVVANLESRPLERDRDLDARLSDLRGLRGEAGFRI